MSGPSDGGPALLIHPSTCSCSCSFGCTSMSSVPHRSIAAEVFLELLRNPDPTQEPLVLDTRSTTMFAILHVKSAISLSLPKLLLKRLQKSPLSSVNLDDLVVCDKERLSRRRSGCPVVLCDDTGSLEDVTSATILGVLASEGILPLYLEGGFGVFGSRYPEVCVANASNSPHVSLIAPLTPSIVIERQSSSNPLYAPASEILPDLLMSGEKDAQNVDFIAAHGITHVLNLTPTPSNDAVTAVAECLCLPLTDTTSQDIIQYLPAAIDFIDKARCSRGKVLVHCFAGASRSAAVTIAYFLCKFSMSLDEAYAAVRSKRPCISPNLNFMGQLQKFEERLRDQSKNSLIINTITNNNNNNNDAESSPVSV